MIDWKDYLTVKNILVMVVCFLAIIFVVFKSCSSPDIGDSQAIIEAAKKELTAKYEQQLKEKDSSIKDKEEKLRKYQYELAVSEARYKTALQTISRLEKEKADVKPPETNEERRSRFANAGFPMLAPAK
jgi:septal ring factor EnvC (AmiA/AmiB activator)